MAEISDRAIQCFVLWCRHNDQRLVLDPDIARNVLDACVQYAPTPASDLILPPLPTITTMRKSST